MTLPKTFSHKPPLLGDDDADADDDC
jgi:hypothetical protein